MSLGRRLLNAEHKVIRMSKTLKLSRPFVVAALALAAGAIPLAAQKSALAPTPPMGWNSWDSYGLTVTEDQFKANVEVEAAKLKSVGYSYAVVDEGWYLGNPEAADKHPETLAYRMDANGRYQPSLNRFATAKGDEGFAPLAKFVHEKGLKFGIHIIRGVPKRAVQANVPVANSGFRTSDLADTTDVCPWNPDNFGVKNNSAGQAWYDSMFKQYASWGVDYVKVDCIASHPYKADEIAMIHKAILKTGRPIILSLSPGPAPLENADAFGEKAELWRISNDVWDRWTAPQDKDLFPQPIKAQFAVIASWTKYVKPGNWPDADMLPLGILGPTPGWGEARETRLTRDEQRTLITLWCIAREPLFFGGNLTKLDDWTESLLTNAEVLAMDQQGHDQRLAATDGDIVAWTSQGAPGVEYLAIFNQGDTPAEVNSSFPHYGLAEKAHTLRELWTKTEIKPSENVKATISPHGAVLFEVKP
jgi:alpha-galactosidase